MFVLGSVWGVSRERPGSVQGYLGATPGSLRRQEAILRRKRDPLGVVALQASTLGRGSLVPKYEPNPAMRAEKEPTLHAKL